jgi:hypothetical protein
MIDTNTAAATFSAIGDAIVRMCTSYADAPTWALRAALSIDDSNGDYGAMSAPAVWSAFCDAYGGIVETTFAPPLQWSGIGEEYESIAHALWDACYDHSPVVPDWARAAVLEWGDSRP